MEKGQYNHQKKENGQPVTTEDERMVVFRNFYKTKFDSAPNLSREVIPSLISPTNETKPPPMINTTTPTIEEVVKAVKCLNNGKSPGIDELPIELIKYSPDAIRELHNIIEFIWENDNLPNDWYEGLFVNIYKAKGSKNDPANYRPMCLLCHAYKVFGIILLERIKDNSDIRIKVGQEGFRNGRGCRDNLHVLRAAINFGLKTHTKVDMTFIDFTQAFDTVSHEFLQIALEEHNIPPFFRKKIGEIYKHATGRIKGAMGCKSEPFPIKRGVLQGDILSPILFVMCLNSVWKRANANNSEGWEILPGWLLDELSYADDIALIDTDIIKNESRLQHFSEISGKTATMRINPNKTVRMQVEPKENVTKTTEEDISDQQNWYPCHTCGRKFPNLKGVSCHKRFCLGPGTADVRPRRDQKADKLIKSQKRDIKITNKTKIKLTASSVTVELANVNTFKYLGSIIVSHGGDEEELEARMAKALQAHRGMKGIWTDKNLTLDIKVRLFKVCVLSVLTYGAESWTVTKPMVRKLRGFTVRCFGSMIANSRNWTRMTENGESRLRAKERFVEATKHIDIISIIDKKRWQWLGHALRMEPNRNPHKALKLLDFFSGQAVMHA